jgi:hypothetical protein
VTVERWYESDLWILQCMYPKTPIILAKNVYDLEDTGAYKTGV